MGVLLSELRDLVKDRVDVKLTEPKYDDDIVGYIKAAVEDLYPLASREVDPVEGTLGSDDRSFSMADGTMEVHILEIKVGTGAWQPTPDFRHWGSKVYLDKATESGAAYRAWGLGTFHVADDVDGSETESDTTLPDYLKTTVVYWATAKFYEALAGNKRKYNSWAAAAGSAANRDVKDSAQYFLQRGNEHLDDRTGPRGQ